MLAQSIRQVDKPISEQCNIEAKLMRTFVDCLFSGRQQIDKHGCQSGLIELSRDLTIAWAETVASTAVGEKNESARQGRPTQISFEHGAAHCDLKRVLLNRCRCGIHTENL
jgi:hypothetical protein